MLRGCNSSECDLSFYFFPFEVKKGLKWRFGKSNKSWIIFVSGIIIFSFFTAYVFVFSPNISWWVLFSLTNCLDRFRFFELLTSRLWFIIKFWNLYVEWFTVCLPLTYQSLVYFNGLLRKFFFFPVSFWFLDHVFTAW